MRLTPKLVLPLALALLSSCARAPLKSQADALRRASAPALSDDLPLAPLADAAEADARALEAQPAGELVFGPERFTKIEYAIALRRFARLVREAPDPAKLAETVEREFDFYEVYGPDSTSSTPGGWGDVFLTSYYEPVIAGSLKRKGRFTQPLYRAPPELVALDLALFDGEKYRTDRKLRGRLDGKAFVPFYSREEIDAKGALKGRKLEICYVDPVDAFFLQIQGSGVVELGQGKRLNVNFADKNGQPYEPLGKFLREAIPIEKMSLQTIEAYVRALPPEQLQRLLNRNPSYVFFEPKEARALTALGVPATAGRTIATDGRWFPKGALAFLSFSKPRFETPDAVEPMPDGIPTSRFVLDQDLGGAITGGGRVDLFWGSGPEARRYAGVMKSRGKLFYLAPKRVHSEK